MNEQIRQSNEGINVLKFIAVVLVILIHETFPAEVGLIAEGIAAMSVPVFFMVSGYYSYGADVYKLQKRALKIFKLMLLANFIYFCWDIAVEVLSGGNVSEWFKESCNVKRVLVFLITNESSLRGHLWFLGALLYSYLFFMIFAMYAEKGKSRLAEIIRKNQVRCLFIVCVLLLGLNIAGGEILTLCGKNIQIPYIRNWLFMGIPFFCMAYCIHAHEKDIYRIFSLKMIWLWLAVSILLNVIEVWLMPPSGLYITTIFVNILTFLLALRTGKVRSTVLVRLGNLADKYGLWVYILQIIVIKNLRWFYVRYGVDDNIIIQILSPFIAIILSFVLSVIPVWIAGVIKRR
ncbi:MAG: acyltransferase [Lachnospiraceae bacterium]|nr:acyltransferase [Lachnospiraceae bacterium]